MNELSVFEYEDVLVVDSRLIAQRLGIEHETFIKNIETYQTQAEQAFGIFRFQIGKIVGRGRPTKYVFLTEDQATFLMTLSRNTPEVVQCKLDLVKAFSKAKKILREIQVQAPPSTVLHTNIYIQRLENIGDHYVDDELWTTFREGAEVLLLVEKTLNVPVDRMDLCDGSIGSHWSKYREGQDWAETSGLYYHVFRDQRGVKQCRAYQLGELPWFRKWLRQSYSLTHLPGYLTDKYGKRAVRQIYTEANAINDHVLQITEERRPTPKQEQLYQKFLDARAALALKQPNYPNYHN